VTETAEEGSTIRLILVVDRNTGSRSQVANLLERMGYETRQARNGQEALEAARQLQPALVLLEVNLAEVSGYEVCRELRDRFGDDIAIIFLSADRTEPYDRVAGLLLGADDYIVKPFDEGELLARVRSALRHSVIPPSNGSQSDPAAEALTSREREVLKLLARGRTQPEIAQELFISPKTVAGHIQRVLTKLGVHSRAQAVALAHEQGLADVEGHTLLRLFEKV
jgi:two-component system, NarL family, nitrate/nitrite response regulator NarL